MNWDIVEGKWNQFKGQLKSDFSKLTDEDINNLSDKKDQVLGKIQERYGILKDEADRRLTDWIRGIDVSGKRGDVGATSPSGDRVGATTRTK